MALNFGEGDISIKKNTPVARPYGVSLLFAIF